jgi:hypothetical protein
MAAVDVAPTREVLVSTSGASAVTVTFSATPDSVSRRSSVAPTAGEMRVCGGL